MTETKKDKSPMVKIVVGVGIGCLVLLVVAGAVVSFVAKKAGSAILQKATGVKTDLNTEGVTFTDEKTGSKVDFGTDKLPDAFPKDFPLYRGAKVAGSMSGSQTGEGSGFWVTLATADDVDKVVAYYNDALKTSGWEVTSTFNAGGVSTIGVKKATLEGAVTVSSGEEQDETTIVIALGQKD